jgi:mono/diheme cytochrome c family protein
MQHLRPVFVAALFALAACTTPYNPLEDYEQVNPVTDLETPAARSDADFSAEDVARGKYLVALLGCGSCHTNGALIGEPNAAQLLAGSDIGIAWSNPLAERNPGIVYAANLTPDVETGIGSWSVAEIVAMIRTGVDKHSGQTLPVMPWPSYAQIEEQDATAIAAYLLSLPAVRHAVPANVRPGQRARAPFVHFGVYRSRELAQ